MYGECMPKPLRWCALSVYRMRVLMSNSMFTVWGCFFCLLLGCKGSNLFLNGCMFWVVFCGCQVSRVKIDGVVFRIC